MCLLQEQNTVNGFCIEPFSGQKRVEVYHGDLDSIPKCGNGILSRQSGFFDGVKTASHGAGAHPRRDCALHRLEPDSA
jgi:hypothetical protein